MDLARHVPASEMKTGPSLQPRPSPSIWASNRLHCNSILQAESTFCATKCRYSSSRSSTVHCKPPPTLISFVPFFMTLAYLKASVGSHLRFCPSDSARKPHSAPPLVSSHQGQQNLAQRSTCTLPASTCFSEPRSVSFAKLRTASHFLLPSSSELLPLSATL